MKETRLEEIQTVLWVTLGLNLLVCAIKIVLGSLITNPAILADGFHSLGDGLNNVIGIFGVKLAKRKPDAKHSYGYGRFEDLTTLLLVVIMGFTGVKILGTGVANLFNPPAVEMTFVTGMVMFASMAINLATFVYESRAGRRLKSDVLVADSSETKWDLAISAGVIVSTWVAGFFDLYWLNGVYTVFISLMIGKIVLEIALPTVKRLADAQVIDKDIVYRAVMAIEGVRFCHAIRSRGSNNAFWLDCHIGVNPHVTVEEAHDGVCHQVKEALRDLFPGLQSVLIHIEPDNVACANREKSTFKDRDPFDDREPPAA